jgi:REP element-mobilizing transposase RayT
MPQYRRCYISGGVFFFTVVTFDRAPFFIDQAARELLHDAWLDAKKRFPFRTEAICLLPDHLHCIWRLPEEDADFSLRWREVGCRLRQRLCDAATGRCDTAGPSHPASPSPIPPVKRECAGRVQGMSCDANATPINGISRKRLLRQSSYGIRSSMMTLIEITSHPTPSAEGGGFRI